MGWFAAPELDALMDELAEVESIKTLKARYFRFLDTKDWAAMREVFADDVVMDTSEAGGTVIEGAEAFLDFLVPILDTAITVHHGHMPEIDVVTPSTASGVWALQDTIWWPDGSVMHGFGHYHETYEKSEGEWRIKSSRLTRLRTDFIGPTA